MLKQNRREEKPAWVRKREEKDRQHTFPARNQTATPLEQRLAAAEAAPATATPADCNSTPYNSAAETPALPGAAGSGVSGGGTTTVNQPWHVPHWLLYAGLGVTALAAFAYIGLRSAAPVQQPRSNTQPTAVSTPYRQPTPAVSQYQKQALEEIALIGQKEPGLASLLQKTDWLSDGVTPGEANFVAKIRSYIVQGNYSTGTIFSSESSLTTILVTGSDKIKREASLAIAQQYLPRVSQLLKIEYKKPLLIIDIFQGGGGGGFRNVSITSPEDLEHELVHTVFETSGPEASPLSQIPAWLGEGVPEIVRSYLRGGNELIEIGRKNVSADLSGRGIGPLYEMMLTPSSRPGGGPEQSVYDGGFLFLAEYKGLVGEDNFWPALHDVNEWRVATGIIQKRKITNGDLVNPNEEVKAIVRQQHEDIKAILKRHVPDDKLPAFNQLYQSRIYGLPETK